MTRRHTVDLRLLFCASALLALATAGTSGRSSIPGEYCVIASVFQGPGEGRVTLSRQTGER